MGEPEASRTSRVARFNVRDVEWEPLPELGGEKAILYRSPDGTRIAGAFRESGTTSVWTYEHSEVVYCYAGTCAVNVTDGESFVLRPGDLVYFEKGLVAEFDMSDDLEMIGFLWSDDKLSVPGVTD